MKKWIFLPLLLCLLLSGCGSSADEGENPKMAVYYLNRQETKIQPVTVEIEGKAAEGQVEELLLAMEESPSEASLKASVGIDFQILSHKLENGQLTLDVSKEYRKLSATTEVLVRAALVRTLTQVNGVDYVAITVEGENLTDNLGNPIGMMSADTFLDNAGDEINSYEKIRIVLFFANEDGDRLVEVSRPLVYKDNVSLERMVVEQLIQGPLEEEKAYPVISPDTKVLDVTVKDGICYINLNEGFLKQTYNVTGDVAIYSIVNSLIELPNVNKVQIAVGGKNDVVFREKFPLTTVFERNLELIKPEETGTEAETETAADPVTETTTETVTAAETESEAVTESRN